MEKKCWVWQEEMSLWLDGELSSAQISDLKAHMGICSTCQSALRAMTRTDEVLKSAPTVSPAPGFVTRFQTRLAARRRRRHSWVGVVVLTLTTIAVVLAAIVVFAIFGLTAWREVLGVSTSGLLGQGIEMFIALGEGGAALLRIGLLVTGALGQGLRHPACVAYAAGTAVLVAIWANVVSYRRFDSRPVAM